MIFTNSRSIIKNNNNNEKKTTKKTMILNYQRKNRVVRESPKEVSIVTANDYVNEVSKRRDYNRITWGEPFWNLFHVLAEKINESYFYSLRMGLLNIIYTICSNLPCPDCTRHAVLYLNSINFNNINTKKELKDMLFNFHNNVNARKQYPLFPRHLLDEKYSCMNVATTINAFLQEFSKKQKSFQLIADNMHRKQQISNLQKWFQDNIKYFQ
jgi:hypothetical protein